MENASKALIIAGAILLSILLIGLGMYIYNQAAAVMNNINMSEQEITSFNAPFEAYIGTNVRGSSVKSLLNKIIANNNTYTDDTSRQVSVVIKAKTSGAAHDLASTKVVQNIQKAYSNLPTGSAFKVSITTDGTANGYSSAGLIQHIYIEEK